jgi:TetR/AcrR family transcriptional repressor of bet genes
VAKQSQMSRPRGLEIASLKTSPTRKQSVAEAMWRVVAASGFEGATLRAIAKEAGCTTGVLMHYFSDKEELLLFSLDWMYERVDIDFAKAVHSENPIGALKDALVRTLPLDEQSEFEGRTWLNFVGRALWHKVFLKEHRRRYARFRTHIEKILKAASENEMIRCRDNFADEADFLLAFLDGLITHALLEPGRFPSSRLRALLDFYMARL